MAKKQRILFVTSEVTPLAKTGGLADVCDAIPKYLAEAGHDVDVIVPMYRQIKEQNLPTETLLTTFTVPLGASKATGAIHRLTIDRPWRALAVENDELYDRASLYTDPETGLDYPDNAERFAFFAKAVLEAIKRLKLRYDIIHAHDWQGGLLISLLRKFGHKHKLWQKPATLIAIHNIGYKGIFPAEKGNVFGLPPEAFNADELEYFGEWSLLKGGIAHADYVTTVSKKYAQEIQTPEFGFGFEGMLQDRADTLVGITHGVDYETWNPATDPFIAANFSAEKMAGKAACKSDLLETFGLDSTYARKPVIGFIGRLVQQKGLDLIMAIIEDILAHGYIVIFLGEGAKQYEEGLLAAQKKFADRMAVQVEFSEEIAHKIEAGADLLLLPSIYEPCGLSQMYAQKYGTLPIVRATGGLDDTVKGWRKGTRNADGFKFTDASPEALLKVLADAAMLFEDKKRWQKLIDNAVALDHSWPKIITKYERLYAKAIRERKAAAKAIAATDATDATDVAEES
jgi:starch synthase